MVKHIGEVLITNSNEFTAQAIELNEGPRVGSFVKLINSNLVIYAVVYSVSTGSIDSNRRPIAFGKSEEELLLEQPQLFGLLKTEFSALIIGFCEEENYFGNIPGLPPRIHSFVDKCTEDEINMITKDGNYLKTITNFNVGYSDQLIISVLKTGLSVAGDSKEYLIKTGKNLLTLLKYDMDRFNMIFRSVR